MKNTDSPAVQLMSLLWGKSQEATGHSWLRLNQGLREGIFLAVKIGMEFAENDLAEIGKRFRGGYWFGDSFETFYHCAITYNNRSAWKAYETYVKRTPFIWTPATLRAHYGGGGQGTTNPPRLAVGAEFAWKGERVTVTSFNDEKGYLVAQSYIREKSENCAECGRQKTWPKDKILHRYTITHADLKAEKARLKEEKSAK
jgi:hypothetical protein